MTDAIVSEREGGLLTLRLNRADKKNALTRNMYSQPGPAQLKAWEAALRFEQLAPAAVQVGKALMKAPDRERLRQVVEAEGKLFVQRLRSPEAIAALSGFMAKR